MRVERFLHVPKVSRGTLNAQLSTLNAQRTPEQVSEESSPAQPVLAHQHPAPSAQARGGARAGRLLVALGEAAGLVIDDTVVLEGNPRLARAGEDGVRLVQHRQLHVEGDDRLVRDEVPVPDDATGRAAPGRRGTGETGALVGDARKLPRLRFL